MKIVVWISGSFDTSVYVVECHPRGYYNAHDIGGFSLRNMSTNLKLGHDCDIVRSLRGHNIPHSISYEREIKHE